MKYGIIGKKNRAFGNKVTGSGPQIESFILKKHYLQYRF